MVKKEEQVKENEIDLDDKRDLYGLKSDESLLSVQFAKTENKYLTDTDEGLS
ncbi:hypothetical protein [Bacillus sp. EB01]|uniref:hypothetical protein n=1 Tax=Bacillus sp. EB01 TaxID=1347086 RepID=UPI000AF32880|nr:hypothetical protein [Bacillus sp. EB01]